MNSLQALLSRELPFKVKGVSMAVVTHITMAAILGGPQGFSPSELLIGSFGMSESLSKTTKRKD
jgi:hypothetical protein